jgi:ribonuclease P protein component
MTGDVLLKHYLKALRLPMFLSEYPQLARQCAEEKASYEDFLLRLAEREVTERERNAVKRRIREACFPAEKELTDFDFTVVPNLNKQKILHLSMGEYIAKRENVVFLGPPGVGKTHLGIALGREACRRGSRVRYFTATGLATAYREARDQREVGRLDAFVKNRDLIVIDELGYVPLGEGGAEHLFGFISNCYERTSVMVTSNLPFAEWNQVFADERLAGALIDRLTHRVHIFDIQGDSYRLKSRLRAPEDGPNNEDDPHDPGEEG